MDTETPGAAASALLSALAEGGDHAVEALAGRLALRRRQVVDAAAKLIRRGYAARAAVGFYRITDAGRRALADGVRITSGPTRPTGARRLLRDTFRQRAWTAMRVRRVFTIGEIVADAARQDTDAERDNARRYIAALRAAGFVVELPRRKAGTAMTSNGFKEFRLTRNTGPRAPVVSDEREAVFDPNTGQEVPCARS
jgi:hypothetical protein